MGHVWFIWALRTVVLLSAPVAFVVVCLHPGLGRAAIGAAAVAADASAFTVMRKAGPIHSCPGQHTRRSVLKARIDENGERLDQYDGLFRALGLDPDRASRKEGLRLIHTRSGDSDPGRRVSLPG
jgi:hypothetical protein